MRLIKTPWIGDKYQLVTKVTESNLLRSVLYIKTSDRPSGRAERLAWTWNLTKFSNKDLVFPTWTSSLITAINREGLLNTIPVLQAWKYTMQKIKSLPKVGTYNLTPENTAEFMNVFAVRVKGTAGFEQVFAEPDINRLISALDLEHNHLGPIFGNTKYRVCATCREIEYVESVDPDRVSGAHYCETCAAARPVVYELRSYGANVLNECIRESFKKVPKDTDDVFLGVELEVHAKGSRQNAINFVGKHMGKYAICKSDGSLDSSYGLEIVTVPATLAAHKTIIWKDFFANEPNKIMKGWDGYNCGMHVHIGLAGLSQLTVGRMLVFINSKANVGFIDSIAGRPANTYCQRRIKTVSDGKIEKRRHEHYDALSFSAHTGKTLELRIFRSNVSEVGFLKNVEFSRAIVDFCRQAGNAQNLTAQKFCEYIMREDIKSTYPNLVKFLIKSKHVNNTKVSKVDINAIITEA